MDRFTERFNWHDKDKWYSMVRKAQLRTETPSWTTFLNTFFGK